MKQTVKAHRMMILVNSTAITAKRQKQYSEETIRMVLGKCSGQGSAVVCIVRKDKDQ
jgi:hypothetical protein